jgi:hypothetical protein
MGADGPLPLLMNSGSVLWPADGPATGGGRSGHLGRTVRPPWADGPATLGGRSATLTLLVPVEGVLWSVLWPGPRTVHLWEADGPLDSRYVEPETLQSLSVFLE